MATLGRSEEAVGEEGIYICADGCERRHYREGERFLTCAVNLDATTWVKVEEI